MQSFDKDHPTVTRKFWKTRHGGCLRHPWHDSSDQPIRNRPFGFACGLPFEVEGCLPKTSMQGPIRACTSEKGCPFFESPDWGCRRDWGYVGQIDIESDGVRPLERGLLGSSFGFYVSMQEGCLNDLTVRWYTMRPIKIATKAGISLSFTVLK